MGKRRESFHSLGALSLGVSLAGRFAAASGGPGSAALEVRRGSCSATGHLSRIQQLEASKC
jgi:hypothetical protein